MKEIKTFERVFKPKGKDSNYALMLIQRKQDFVMRKTKYYTSIIHDNQEAIFPSKDKDHNFPINQLWLFNAVRMDALKFLKNNPDFEMRTKLPTNVTNVEYDNSYGEITGTDIDSAYWTIAYRMGIISERTYKKANENPSAKPTKLASLAVLGRTKAYHVYSKGEKQKEPLLVNPEHDKLRDIYRMIRYECYSYMSELARQLGKDFEAYRTDCIYYRDTKKNREIVYSYLDLCGFSYKQLVFDEGIEISE